MSRLQEKRKLDLEFLDLTYCVQLGRKKGKKIILNGVKGKFCSGEMSAILGPSGAGKSTLMNILAGYKTNNTSGEILVNGNSRHLKRFCKQSCYLMQDNYLLQYLTIEESMNVAASLKLGDHVPNSEKRTLIQEILEILNLKECLNTRVSNLSGGEKKRLSIAQELVNNPPIMFFDEPTSGLDSQNSYQCINILSKLAERGHTIICTIHQPSARILEKFDHLYALAEGNCIYRGAVRELVPFFSSVSLQCPSYHNPADFLIEIASGEYGNYITQMAEAVESRLCSETNKQYNLSSNLDQDSVFNEEKTQLVNKVLPKLNIRETQTDIKLHIPSCEQDLLSRNVGYPASFWTQFIVLFKRTLRSIVRDWMLVHLRLIAYLIVGIFIGILYYNIGNEASEVFSNIGYLFISQMFLICASMMSTVVTFPLDMNVFIKERQNHWYSLKAYYIAKTLADIPFQFIFSILFTSIVYFMTKQPNEIERFALFTLLCSLLSLIGQSVGLAIGALFDIQVAVLVASIVIIPIFLLSGMLFTVSRIPVYLRWLSYLSYMRYGYEGIIRTTYSNREELHCSEDFCLFKHPVKIFEQLKLKEDSLWLDILILFVFYIVVRLLGYIAVRWKLRRDR